MPLPAQSLISSSLKRTRFKTGVIFVAIVWTALLIWLGADSEPLKRNAYHFTSLQSDYYNSLVDGIRHGHTYLPQIPHPDRLSKDIEVRRRAPYLLDASLFEGRYYLYYGVTPAVILLLPYNLLTGYHLQLNAACLVFALIGLCFSCFWTIDVARLFQTEDRFLSGFIATTLIVVVPATTWMVRRSQFYDLPIVAGYACITAFVFFLGRAVYRSRPRFWLAWASLAFGLAVGCRANLLLSGVALLVVFFGIRSWRAQPKFWVACFLPAAAIGAGLAAYNYARFGNVLDFGFSYGLNPFFDTTNPLFSWRFISFNFESYFLQAPALAPRFPFVFPISGAPPEHYSNAESLAGFLPVTLLCIWILPGALLGIRQTNRKDILITIFLLLIFSVQMAFILPLGIRAYRYANEFLTPLAFLLAWITLRQTSSFRAVGWWNLGSVILILIAASHSILGSIELFNIFHDRRAEEFAALEKSLTPSQRTLERLGAPRPALMEFTVSFTKPEKPTAVPLVVTGLPQAYDQVTCIVDPSSVIEIEVQHSGFGGPRSAILPIEWGKPYTLTLSLGSFYPSAADPYYAGLSANYRSVLKSTAFVQLNGVTVLNRRMNFYESASWVWRPEQVLSNAQRGTEKVMTITSVIRHPTPPAQVPFDTSFSAIFDLDLQLPEVSSARDMPLIQAGGRGSGTLLVLCPQTDGRYQFNVDQWGGRYLTGVPFSFNALTQHNFKILVGPAIPFDEKLSSLATNADKARLGPRLIVWFDGRVVASFELSNPRPNLIS